MSDPEFFTRVNAACGFKRKDLVEKDYLIHRLLAGISRDPFLGDSLVFKGGTCLIKAYMGFFRFSEDIDLIWADPALWEGRAKNQIVKDCSSLTDRILDTLRPIGTDIGLSVPSSKEEGMVQAFRRSESAYETARFRLHGLEPNARYLVENLDVPGTVELAGRTLAEAGLAVPIREQPGSAVITYRKVNADLAR